jgi:hypothetical protein
VAVARAAVKGGHADLVADVLLPIVKHYAPNVRPACKLAVFR